MSLPKVPASTLHRIAALLSSGLKLSQVSSVTGISPSRLSQISSTEEFQLILADKDAEVSKQNIEEEAISSKYLVAEHILIDTMTAMAASAELRDVTAALRVVAERQEKVHLRKNPIMSGNVITQNIVNLQLPTHALPEIVISSDNEVMEVNSKNMAPLTAQGVENLFAAMKTARTLNAVLETSPILETASS